MDAPLKELMGRADSMGILESKQELCKKLIRAAYWIGANDGLDVARNNADAERRSEPRD